MSTPDDNNPLRLSHAVRLAHQKDKARLAEIESFTTALGSHIMNEDEESYFKPADQFIAEELRGSAKGPKCIDHFRAWLSAEPPKIDPNALYNGYSMLCASAFSMGFTTRASGEIMGALLDAGANPEGKSLSGHDFRHAIGHMSRISEGQRGGNKEFFDTLKTLYDSTQPARKITAVLDRMVQVKMAVDEHAPDARSVAKMPVMGYSALMRAGVDIMTPDERGVRPFHYIWSDLMPDEKRWFSQEFNRMNDATAKMDAGAPLSDFTLHEALRVANAGRIRELFSEERMAQSPDDAMALIGYLPPYLRDQLSPQIASFASGVATRENGSARTR